MEEGLHHEVDVVVYDGYTSCAKYGSVVGVETGNAHGRTAGKPRTSEKDA